MSAAPVGDSARIARLLTGETAPALRLRRAALAAVRPMETAGDALSALLGEPVEATLDQSPDGDAEEGPADGVGELRCYALSERDGGAAWIELSIAPDAALGLGSRMLGVPAATDAPGELHWRLGRLVATALGASMGPEWSLVEQAPPGSLLEAVPLRLALTLDGSRFSLGVRVAAALALRSAQPLRPKEVAAPPSRPSARRGAEVALEAALALERCDLSRILRLRVGDVLPLSSGLDGVRVSEGGRALFAGMLGRSGDRVCVRLHDMARRPAPSFAPYAPDGESLPHGRSAREGAKQAARA